MNNFRNGLNVLRKVLSEKKKLKFAWLGNFVAGQMEEISVEHQNEAGWQVQCLMRELISKPQNISPQSLKDVLELLFIYGGGVR